MIQKTLSTIVDQLTEARARSLIRSFEVQHYKFNLYYKTGLLIELHEERAVEQMSALVTYFRNLQHYVTVLTNTKLLIQIDESSTKANKVGI